MLHVTNTSSLISSAYPIPYLNFVLATVLSLGYPTFSFSTSAVVDAKDNVNVVGTLNVSVECVAALRAVHRDLQSAGMENLYPWPKTIFDVWLLISRRSHWKGSNYLHSEVIWSVRPYGRWTIKSDTFWCRSCEEIACCLQTELCFRFIVSLNEQRCGYFTWKRMTHKTELLVHDGSIFWIEIIAD